MLQRLGRSSRFMQRYQQEPEAGFSLIEILAALIVIAIVSVGAAAFFVTGIRGVNGQKQRQQAVYIADSVLEQARAINPGYMAGTTRSELVSGRTQAQVQSLLASTAATRLHISSQDDVSAADLNLDYDPTTTDPVALKPNPPNQTVNGTTYQISTFVDVCWISASTSLNAGSTSVCGPTKVDSTYTEDYRVSVDVYWTAASPCSNGCDYSDSTLIDPNSDSQFNSNTSTPVFTITSPSPAQVPIDAYAPDSSCNSGSQRGNAFTLTGSGFRSGLTVHISPGGGSIYNVVTGSGTVTFCLTESSSPGTYTLTVINPDYGLYKQQIVEEPYVSQASGWTSTGKALALTGDGFESGATVTCSNGDTCSGYTVNGATSISLANYVGPTNGGTGTITVTNPDTTSTSYTITAPNLTLASFGTLRHASTVTVTLTGTGFVTGSSGTTFGASWKVGSTTYTYTPTAVTVTNSTSAHFTVQTPPSAGTYTFTATATNPNGGTDSSQVTNERVS